MGIRRNRGRQVNQGNKDTGSRSSSEETVATWVWYEVAWWLRVEQDMNSRQRRRASRAVRQALGQDSKKLERWLDKLMRQLDSMTEDVRVTRRVASLT